MEELIRNGRDEVTRAVELSCVLQQATQMQAAEKWFLSLAVLSQRENLESCAESL